MIIFICTDRCLLLTISRSKYKIISARGFLGYLVNWCENERTALRLCLPILLFFELQYEFSDAARVGYFLECAVGIDDARLDVLEEVHIHSLEVVQVEFLHAKGCDGSLVGIQAELFFFRLGCHQRRHFSHLHLDWTVVLNDAVSLCFDVDCELIHVALL